ncbi:hypothetical protein RclHR1_04820001 [Rhizophagus clarus]|uniref:CigA protein n=1 Tax=Rhizophagus clarus TaxID=94130 RepID=A0A2Z6RPF6_9GLOM|nr:hypothetical protein RclHR1_04820001 [Rhizophagus clarus]GES81902.1 CigA protein [Rhizophagus clarus]
MLSSSSLSIINHRWFFFVITFFAIYLAISYIITSFTQIDNEITDKKKTYVSYIDETSTTSNSHSCFGTESNEERYMTYLPHSGFHNQRNMLENAVFLSWVLNRTLIMPPVIFTKKSIIPHRPYNILYKMITGNMTNNVITCKRKGVEDNRCMFTQLDWEELMDFKFIKKNIRYIHRGDQNFNVNELYSFLNITNPENQVFTLAEETRYDFQFYDDENITKVSDDQFDHLIHLCSLQRRKEKLIHFGSIYHLNRFNLRFKKNIEFLKSVRENMIINHPVLLDIGDKISEQLGGLGSFIGVHLRLGDMGFDKKFGQKAEENVDSITKSLLNEIGDIPSSYNKLEEIEVSDSNYLIPTNTMIESEKCLRSISPEQRNFPIIYLASDKPRNDHRLKKFLREFPCVFMLFSNFEKYLEPLKKVKNPRDGALLYRYFVPFVDGIVAARGNKFIGTPESTFSDYVLRLHEHWVGPQ